ncbi:MAG: hypothetical protein WA979_10085 [Pacificimonas sp.]
MAIVWAFALILPGVVALFIFFSTISTAEVHVQPPPLNSLYSISMIGLISLGSHAVYAFILSIGVGLSIKLNIPIANPYLFLSPSSFTTISFQQIGLSLTGFLWPSLIGALVGWIGTKGRWEARNELLYGWLYPLIDKARPENAYINAFALTSNKNGSDILGYEGTVENLVVDRDKAIVGATLRNVETFYIRMNQKGTRRVAGGTQIDRISLRSDDFQNIALEVIRDETQAS